jgi:hypothetical protein
MRKTFIALAAALLAAAGCTSGAGTTLTPQPMPSAASSVAIPGTPAPSAPALQQVHDPGRVTGTLTGPCHATGTVPDQLPDPHCTPGAYDPVITAAILCSGTYSTRSYRPPASETTAFKYRQAYPAYGLPASTTTELDHLVSLELGGSNSAANLWPEPPGVPNPKDSVENALHNWVCQASGAAAQDRLNRAQVAIATDWLTAKQVLGVG